MYPYHNRIKQRIENGELVEWYIASTWPKIGKCLVLVFSTEPFFRPIRPERWEEYLAVLGLHYKMIMEGNP